MAVAQPVIIGPPFAGTNTTEAEGVSRFAAGPGTYSRIIQCAEAPSIASTVLRNTYTSSAWQDGLLNIAESATAGSTDAGTLTALAHQLDPYFGGLYPATKTVVDSTGAAVVERGRGPSISLPSTEHGVPHISLVFREMWETTNLNLFSDLRKKHVERCGHPQFRCGA